MPWTDCWPASQSTLGEQRLTGWPSSFAEQVVCVSKVLKLPAPKLCSLHSVGGGARGWMTKGVGRVRSSEQES